MERKLKCPVCGKPLTEGEYDKALGLWKEKQQHIKHLEVEQKKVKQQERLNKKKLSDEKRKLKDQEKVYKEKAKEQTKQLQESKQKLDEQKKKSLEQMKDQREKLQKSFTQKLKSEVKKGVEEGVEEQKRAFKKQQAQLSKTKNKMNQLEKSLKLSARKYETANQEIKKLKEQIEKGITPQIEGLLEETKLLTKLKSLFPKDKFEHPGKGGDIIHTIIQQGKEIGKIVYECKKVKKFNKNFIDQAKRARTIRKADFAVLVTNVFPTKMQYYFVEKNVFVISPVSFEPIIYTLRESLIKMAMLKLSNEAKEKAVQRIYDYLSSNDYNNKINDLAGQLMDLGKDLKSEIVSHKRTWEKRYGIYRSLFNDIGIIDYQLRDLIQSKSLEKPKLQLPEKSKFIEIDELQR